MNHVLLYLLGLFLFLCTGTLSSAQQAMVTSGGTFSQSGGSVSYAAGLIPFHRHETTVGSLTEGLFHIYRVKTFRAKDGINRPDVTIFPNPTPDWVNIRIDGHSTSNLTAVLSDIKGQTMTTINLQDRHEGRFSLHGYKSGIYFLNIRKGSTPIETFKIIKL